MHFLKQFMFMSWLVFFCTINWNKLQDSVSRIWAIWVVIIHVMFFKLFILSISFIYFIYFPCSKGWKSSYYLEHLITTLEYAWIYFEISKCDYLFINVIFIPKQRKDLFNETEFFKISLSSNSSFHKCVLRNIAQRGRRKLCEEWKKLHWRSNKGKALYMCV